MEGVRHSYNAYVQDNDGHYDDLSYEQLWDNNAVVEASPSYASLDINYAPIVWYRTLENDYHALADADYYKLKIDGIDLLILWIMILNLNIVNIMQKRHNSTRFHLHH